MSCKHCGDACKTFRCSRCRADVGAACVTCHNELWHDEPDTKPIQPKGGRADAAISRRLRDDPSPWDENNTRAMEDRG